jgi:hypothetical protein
MLEITGDDIAELSDEDLRTLVGLLCEAEMRRRNLPLSAVTWGGDQTAKDGGLDGRVALAKGTTIDGFVPKTETGFQVKKSDMPRQAIIKEMTPKGVLRPAIRELADASGAYVIVSSAGSTSDSALNDRRSAMSEAIQELPNSGNLTLEFYDRNRMATWVRDHGGLMLWVRSRIGRALPGWRGYGSWSSVPAGANASYLTDDTARIRVGDKDEGDGLSATEGINRIRDVLRTAGGVVRLIGLSGVGKTRLAEALFDSGIGAHSLDPSWAFYTDVADGPVPQPVGFASDLIAMGMRAVLVVDNCPPDIHRRLAEVVRGAGTTISVITIEYDIREDQAEGTDVFALETSSEALIQKLVAGRFPALSEIDTRTIAEFSGGNARVALAVAATVPKNEAVAGLRDAELFRRLFEQRNEPDPSLRVVAEVCSLVYSFDGESRLGEDAELPVLCGLSGKSADDLHRELVELKRRDLLQKRGPWRAVLPHAIANRLAVTALENFPTEKVVAAFESGPRRLLRSFSRRLGYLDHCEVAREVARRWLRPGGLLSKVTELDELGRAMFNNVAPVVPETVLAVIENALAPADEEDLRRCEHFVPILRSLAYDPAHFERAVGVLLRFARLSNADQSDNRSEAFTSLFYITLSGTHAPLDLRLKVIGKWLRSTEPTVQQIGAKALQSTFKTDGFSPWHSFEFGARSRDYGYHPKTRADIRNWFATALRFAEPFALSVGPEAQLVRIAIAHEFRGLWTDSGQADQLEQLARAIASKQFWREGWIAAHQTRIYDRTRLSPRDVRRLEALEKDLRPKDLFDNVRGRVLGSTPGGFELDDYDDVEERDYQGAAARAAAGAEQLGRDVAVDEALFAELLGELLGGGGKVADFGRGLALGANEPIRLWALIVEKLATTKITRVDLLGGFLAGLHSRDMSLVNVLLNQALEDQTLAPWVPILQMSTGIDQDALRRLHSVLERDAAPIERFVVLAYGRCSDGIPGRDFKELVLTIARKPGGMPIAIEILSMRLHSDEAAKRPPSPEVVELGKALLSGYTFRRSRNRLTREDYELGRIIHACLRDDDGRRIARELCRELAEGIGRFELSAHDYGGALASLFAVHPTDMLDELFSGDAESQRASIRLVRTLGQFRLNPMVGVDDDVIITWCDGDPEARYPIAAAVASLFKRPSEKAPHEWTSLATTLLLRAPNPEAVFREIVMRLRPTSWSGSRTTKLETRLQLLGQLDVSGISQLQTAFADAKTQLTREIEEERQRETAEENDRSSRFE